MPAKKRAKKAPAALASIDEQKQEPAHPATQDEQEHGSAIERPAMIPLAPDRAD